jgi:hypothetical protein
MGEHKRTQQKLKRRWIICTKLSVKSDGGEILSEIWLPIGEHAMCTTTGTIGSSVFDYASAKEAQKALDEIADLKDADTENFNKLTYCACEVRYIPRHIKPYNKDWYTKDVSKEVSLKVKNPKRRSQEDINP